MLIDPAAVALPDDGIRQDDAGLPSGDGCPKLPQSLGRMAVPGRQRPLPRPSQDR
jgi:hypothetical protein